MTHSADDELPEPLDELVLAVTDQLVELVEVNDGVPNTSRPDSSKAGNQAVIFADILEFSIIWIVFTGKLL